MDLSPGPWAGALRIRSLPAVNAAALLLLAILIYLLAGCVSSGDRYLIAALSDLEKARALVGSGIAAYNARLVKGSDYDAVDEVAACFDRALAFDPENADAVRYAALVGSYRQSRLATVKKEAGDLLKKQKRTEAEDYAIAIAVRKGLTLDPADEEVKALAKQTAELSAGLVELFLSRMRLEMVNATADAPAAARERSWIIAWDQAGKALELDPGNGDAQKAAATIRGRMEILVKEKLDAMAPFVVKGAWTEARTRITSVKDLDAKLGKAFAAQISQPEYDLYMKWAAASFAARNYADAGSRVDSAIAAKKTTEAAELKKKIETARSSAELGAGYDSGIQNIDTAIAAGDLPKAQRLITALAATKLDAAQAKTLDGRRARLATAQATFIAEAYDHGVKAYKEERFLDAITALESVLAIDPDYKDAADYLDKARTKQKVLEGF